MKKETSNTAVAAPPKIENNQTPKFPPEALAFLENSEKVIHLPHKYFAAQRSVLVREIKKLHQSTPTLPIRQVVVNILSDMPNFLPPENILDVTRLIVEQWQKHQEEAVAQ